MRSHASVLVLLLAALTTACSENLEGGAACPSLCPEQSLNIETTEIEPVVLDTTLAGLTTRGTERFLLVASRGDTAVTRVVLRYDSLVARGRRSNTDTTTFAITRLDSAWISFRLDTTGTRAPQGVTLEAYDIDTTGVADSATAPLLALFRPERLVGSVTYTAEQLRDTTVLSNLRLPLDTTFVRRTVADSGARIRIGLAVRGGGGASAQLRLLSLESSSSPALNYLPARPDTSDTTSMQLISRPTISRTPNADLTRNVEYFDYTIIADPTAAPPAQLLAVGGLPGRRSYLRFELPPGIVDSATVTRATLILTQRPNPGSVDGADSMVVFPAVVLAGAAVTDPARAASIILRTSFFNDSLLVAPADSGAREIDVTSLLRRWRGVDPAQAPRAIVLVTPLEGSSAAEVLFFSRESDPALRPRLRISYVPRVGFGLP